jgi:hypothetical protein
MMGDPIPSGHRPAPLLEPGPFPRRSRPVNHWGRSFVRSLRRTPQQSRDGVFAHRLRPGRRSVPASYRAPRRPPRPANRVFVSVSHVNQQHGPFRTKRSERNGLDGLWTGSFGPSSKFDEGPVVYRPPRQIAPPATPGRGFGALRFDPRAQHPKRNAPLSAPKPPALSRSLFFSIGLVNRGVPSGGQMRTQLRSLCPVKPARACGWSSSRWRDGADRQRVR